MKETQPLDAVENRLLEEARELRGGTAFSPLLHEKIMASLRQSGLAPSAAPPRREAARFWRIAVPGAIAAAIAIATWMALRPPQAQPAQVITVASRPGPMPEIPLPQLNSPSTDVATAALERGQFAYLDRDANRLFTFVADQIPSFPEHK
jgi:hypothetical protein